MARARGTERSAKRPNPPNNNDSSGSPISIRDSISPAAAALPAPTIPSHRRNTRSEKNSALASVSPQTIKRGRVQKAVPKKEAKPAPVKKECIICITTRQVGNTPGRGFKTLDSMCEHFQNVCNVCIGKMIKEKIVKRELDEAVLACAFPDCEHMLDYNAIIQLIFKNGRESWDNALLSHHVRSSENYVACLNSQCGKYFSIEDCQGKISKSSQPGRGRKVTCPYCAQKMCMSCMRAWHTTISCDEAKDAEEKKSIETIKKMAKPCPKCGVNIEKNGGCNHMHCRHCKHDFCFQCLAPFSARTQHASDCIEVRQNIIEDPRNWAPDDFNPAPGWIDNMIDGAGQAPPQPPNVVQPAAPPPNHVGGPQQAGNVAGVLARMIQIFGGANFDANINVNVNADTDRNRP